MGRETEAGVGGRGVAESPSGSVLDRKERDQANQPQKFQEGKQLTTHLRSILLFKAGLLTSGSPRSPVS